MAAALAGWWLARNPSVYGWPDLFGLIRHGEVVAGQPGWSGTGQNLETIRYFAYSTFRSFWAQFGWMAFIIDLRFYWLLLLFTLLAALGCWRFWLGELPHWPTAARSGIGFLVAGIGVVTIELLIYNLGYAQPQGRYLFPAMLPIGILVALGWRTTVVSALDSSARTAARLLDALTFGLCLYWIGATASEAIIWLLMNGPARVLLHLAMATESVRITRTRLSHPGT